MDEESIIEEEEFAEDAGANELLDDSVAADETDVFDDVAEDDEDDEYSDEDEAVFSSDDEAEADDEEATFDSDDEVEADDGDVDFGGDDEAETDGDDEVEADGDDEPLSDEELDKIADTAIAALEDILKYFNLGEVTIDEYEGDEGELILDITGEDLAVLIGRHGKTLDALQFLISSITARTMGFRYPVVVDVEGYKGRQRQKLENLAFSSAKRALSQGRSVKMRPMTPYERRIVHIALRGFEGVSTASEGEGSGRRVVVIPD